MREEQKIEYSLELDTFLYPRDQSDLISWLSRTLGPRGEGRLKVTVQFAASTS